MSKLFKEARRLYRQGFAVHWLHPNSKRPIGNEWTTGPRKPWPELNAPFSKANNVGVRLGSPSKIGKRGFLCVIDVDVKGKEKRHRKEAEAALLELIGEKNRVRCPEVFTGRGGGSKHLYCVTPKPFKTFNPARSEERIKYLSPTKDPSKRELAELTPQEIKDGWRFGPAWEISLYSDGRQVVLPPSIHPDTKKEYTWTRGFDDAKKIPIIEFAAPEKSSGKGEGGEHKRRGPQETVEDFEVTKDFDICWFPDISDEIRNLIVKGEWKGRTVNDRSAYMLPAAKALVCAGLDKNTVLTALTDKRTFLGECGYDHTKSESRKRAAQWVWNYTVKDIMDERNPTAVFGNLPVKRAEPLKEEEAEAQADAVMKDKRWTDTLEQTDKGFYKPTFNNCKTILMNVCGTPNVVGRNEFAANDYYLCNTPWRSKKGDAVSDMDIVRIKEFCAEQYGIEFGDNTINQALMAIADLNRFHPVREWIQSLRWDGTPRIETWLRDFAGAVGPDDYLCAVSRKVLVAMVKRVFEPGCKFDHVLILEGIQGSGKSTLLANLAGNEWFSDETLNIGDKDAVLTMQSKWLIELGELSALSRSEIETMKAFITRRTDRIRAPYGKRVEEFPRQCIFIGSTNLDEYLRDETGNRRFWPVKCGEIDFIALGKARAQLFAEAYAYYQLRETLYLEGPELNALAKIEQEKRAEVDEWYGTIADIVNGPMFPRHSFEMREVSKSMDQFSNAHQLSPWDQKRIAKCLRVLGYEKFQSTQKNDRRRLWRLVSSEKGNLKNTRGTLENDSKVHHKNTINKVCFL